MKIKEYNQMMKYLTRPATPKQEKDNSPVMVNNGEITTENAFKKSLPIEDQPGYDADKDPNLLRRIKYYQGESLGPDFDRAIALEDEELKKLGRDPANILQRNRNVNPLVPKRATTKQMQELKGKIDKYKNNHFPKEKPFKKPTLKDRPVRKPGAVPPKTNTIKMDPIKIDPILPTSFFKKPETDPRLEALGKKIFEEAKQQKQEKIRNSNSGLGYFSRGTGFNRDE